MIRLLASICPLQSVTISIVEQEFNFGSWRLDKRHVPTSYVNFCIFVPWSPIMSDDNAKTAIFCSSYKHILILYCIYNKTVCKRLGFMAILMFDQTYNFAESTLQPFILASVRTCVIQMAQHNALQPLTRSNQIDIKNIRK